MEGSVWREVGSRSYTTAASIALKNGGLVENGGNKRLLKSTNQKGGTMKKITWVFIMFAVVFFYVLDGTGACHSITDVQLSPPSPATLPFDQRVEISFNYNTDQAGGVRIFVRPFTYWSLTPNYAASGSPLYPVGNGNETAAYFTIKSGEVTVDQIRFRMTNANQSQVLLEFFRAVQYQFGVSGGGGGGGGGCFVDSIK